MAIFVAVIGAAVFFDAHVENSREVIFDLQEESGKETQSTSAVHFFSQAATATPAKFSVSRTPIRILVAKSQDKLIQKYHQLRNYQVLKAEVQTQTAPLILSYHYLAFKNYHFTQPDDDPVSA